MGAPCTQVRWDDGRFMGRFDAHMVRAHRSDGRMIRASGQGQIRWAQIRGAWAHQIRGTSGAMGAWIRAHRVRSGRMGAWSKPNQPEIVGDL